MTGRSDLLDGIESVQSLDDLVSWLSGRPDRIAWLSKFTGLSEKKGSAAKDTNVSATVETELPLPEGPRVFASMQAEDSKEAFRLAKVQEKNIGARTNVRHVRTRVSAWKRDRNGELILDENGRPIPAAHAPMYKPAQFYRYDDRRPRVRDEYWTDSRGIILPEVAQDALSFKYEHAPVGKEHTPEAKKDYIEDGSMWWRRRSSILRTDPNRKVLDPSVINAIILARDEKRAARKQQAIDLALRKETDSLPAEVPPVIPAKPALPAPRMKTREERFARAEKRRLDRMFQIMTGERAELLARVSELTEKHERLTKELADFSLQRKVARKMFRDAKESGLGQYSEYHDRDDRPAFEESSQSPWLSAENLLHPYRDLKRDINQECEFRREELLEIEAEIASLRRKIF